MKRATKKRVKLSVSKVTDSSKIKLRRMAKRGSVYDPIFNQMRLLKGGKGIVVNLNKGDVPKTIHNRLNAAMRREQVNPPAGCVWMKRTTADGNIAISCVKKKG